ncbi:MAG: Gfo/Idh/MocA family oxidoreductase, partial [Spirochaetes bacterium]|nr:Gfo/Idh/MocA family oxidoreductase [Spirochaetota bacterium]
MPSTPVRIAIIGLGGFAATHHRVLMALEARGASRLVATCDPFPGNFRANMQEWKFEARGVDVFDDYRKMIESIKGRCDVLVVPTPIPLHAEMHRAGVEAGLAVYLEKPPTLDPAELESMIAVDARAAHQTMVGFNFIVEPARQRLKERLCAGEFGALQSTDLMAHWPRPRSYYRRAAWAGRLVQGPQLVLDSPLGNAMAHQVHNLFHWLGSESVHHWAPIEAVRAEIYRAHAIQGGDTFFAEGRTAGKVPFRVTMSHACDGAQRQWERVRLERAEITWTLYQNYRIAWEDGRVEEQAIAPMDHVLENHLHYYDYLSGRHRRPLTTLADSLPFVTLNNLVYVSAGLIQDLPQEVVSVKPLAKDGKADESVAWNELEAASQRFFKGGDFPSAGLAGGKAGEWVSVGDLG